VTELSDAPVVAEGLAFPEGPVALDDGSLLVVDAPRHPEPCAPGRSGGGRGRARRWPERCGDRARRRGLRLQQRGLPPDRARRVERIDLSTGKVERLLERGGSEPLRAPNDLVFDRLGGLWFTDYGGIAAVGSPATSTTCRPAPTRRPRRCSRWLSPMGSACHLTVPSCTVARPTLVASCDAG